jgi:hypothetical protein
VRTNAPTRKSRLYSGIGTYLRKSVVTVFRVHTLYRPLKTFFAIGTLLVLAGLILGGRFLYYFWQGDRGGHIQSLILASVFLVSGFNTWLIALLADLIAVNRRIGEDVLIRLKRLEMPERARAARPQQQHQPQRDRGERPRQQRREAAPVTPSSSKPETQWVWLIDEEKNKAVPTPPPAPPSEIGEDTIAVSPQRAASQARRRRRRGGRGVKS